MKKIFAVAGVLVALSACKTTSTGYQATDTDVMATTTPVETTFVAQYPNATNVIWGYYDPVVETPVDWDLIGYAPLDASNRLVHFSQDNQTYYVLYDRNGYRIASAYTMSDLSALPSNIASMLTWRYPGYTISGLSRVTLNNGMAYEVELSKFYYTARVLVDDTGNIIDSKMVVKDKL